MKRKAEITIEEQETVILRQSDSYLSDYCPRCQGTVRLLAPEILAILVPISEREIFRLIELGRIHFVETKRIYVCPSCVVQDWRLEINE